ncbi:hypothetical protein MUN84_12165 [Hymenobacter sp. 5516J-16]|uniref:hypothetical protein n=1 Tax=Hymenobacter sp. 5516J-16 TaxID=2932253 RepID=UPI001FD46FAD|nr:hypothetical protein [Hymenobacter sp. 5516J-16]UOQ75465.1 hypothetical protein MUN84_12165 [Hymenobacter sp. 5516J-16]
MKTYILLGAVATSAALLTGCATSGSVSKADKRFTQGEYETAIALYKKDVTKGRNIAQSNYRIAESYRLSNRLELAEPYYKAALDGKAKAPDAGFRYAQALRASGKTEEAATQFEAYAQAGSNRTLAEQAEAAARTARASTALLAMRTNDEVTPLDQINTSAAEFSATRMPETKELVFASGREGKVFQGNGEGFNDLYAIKFEDEQKLTGGTVRKLESIFNSEDRHEASATYSPDGKMMVFARSNDGSKKGYLSVDLWASYYKNGAWSEPEILRGVNSSTADEFSPVFSPDGQTLYFTSTRKGASAATTFISRLWKAPAAFLLPKTWATKSIRPVTRTSPPLLRTAPCISPPTGIPALVSSTYSRCRKAKLPTWVHLLTVTATISRPFSLVSG